MPSNSLEQEAMDRVRRMYSSFGTRAENPRNAGAVTANVGHSRDQHADFSEKKEFDTRRHEPKPLNPEPHQPSVETSKSDQALKQNSLLDIFMKDSDQSLILLLLVLLMKDGADMNLMLALMYLLI